jgi:ATP-dependent Clp protease adaptor protein ClpS
MSAEEFSAKPSGPRQPACGDADLEHLYKVVVLNDEYHHFGYVITVLQEVFGYTWDQAQDLTSQIDRVGRAIVAVTSREDAERKRAQILAYGRDPLVFGSTGPLQALIEPVLSPVQPESDPGKGPPEPPVESLTATDSKARPPTLPMSRWKALTEPIHEELFEIVLVDDDEHSYEYVIRMLGEVFGYSEEEAFRAAKEVDTHGEMVLGIADRTEAEALRDKVSARGPDPLLQRSKTSMRVNLRPASTSGRGQTL